jgi:hypothetical protein
MLLAATATKWASPARLPYELTRAGFDVALISSTGPSTVVRCRQSAEANRFAELLAAGFGISGFFGPEFIEREHTKEV